MLDIQELSSNIYDIVVDCLKDTNITTDEYEDIKNMIYSELSSLKDYESIKIMDSYNRFGEENGVFIQLYPTLSLLKVDKFKKTQSDTTKDIILNLLAYSYVVRILSQLTENMKNKIVFYTQQINNCLN